MISTLHSWIGLLFCVCLPITKANAQTEEKQTERQAPLVQVEFDEAGFEMALEAFRCLKKARTDYREELSNLASFAERQERLNAICEVSRRNSELMAHLRTVYPDASDEQLAEEHKKLVLLAAFYKPKGDASGD